MWRGPGRLLSEQIAVSGVLLLLSPVDLALTTCAFAIAPSDPQIVWAGTGETFIRSNISIGNGIYKSTDAGKTWTHMGLEKTGRIGRVVIDPRDPDIVFAAALGHCYGPQPDRGVYRTTDGGKTWDKVLFVDENTGAADIVMDPTNPRILFAGTWQVDIKTWGRWSGGPGSGVFKSADGGNTWKRLARGLPEPPLGKIAVAVAPSRSDRVYALIETGDRGSLWRSDDSGESWRLMNHSRLLNERPHYYTRMAISPADHSEVYFPSNGMSVTYDGGDTAEQIRGWGGDNHDMWFDPTNADRIMIGNDGGVLISTNHGRGWNRIVLPIAQMYHVDVDGRIPYNVFGNRQDGPSVRGPSNSRTGGTIPSGYWQTVAGCESGFGIPDPVDNNIMWGGCYNAGLDRMDLRTLHRRSVRVWPKSPMGSPPVLLKYRFNWTFPIAISPHDHNQVYVGSQHVHQTTDGGQSWTVLSPDLSTQDKSRLQDSGGLTLDNLGVECGGVVFAIYKTADYGKTWKLISSDIPKSVFSYTHCVREDPVRKGLLYAGTENAVYVSFDDGGHWVSLQNNLPHAPVHWLVVQPHFNDLVVATYGRGFYILDDVTPLQQLTSTVLGSDAHLFAPRPAYRFQSVSGITAAPNDQSVGQNPPDGASINYYLKAAPKGDVIITIENDRGQTIRRLQGTRQAGLNRVWWDLRHERTKEARLRTTPPGNPHIWEEKRFKEARQRGWMPIVSWGIGGGLTGPKAVPGTYTAKLTVGGKELTQKLVVKKDPNTAGTEADIQAQVKMALAVQADLNTVVDAINQIEWVKKQIDDLTEVLGGTQGASELVSAARQLDKKISAVEVNFFQPILAEGDAKSFRAPNKLYSQLALLAGDVMSADFPPTNPQVEVFKELQQELASARTQLKEALSNDLAAFNRMLVAKNMPGIIVTTP